MRIGIVANPGKVAAVQLARRALERIGDRAEVVLSEETRAALGGGAPAAEIAAIDADALVVIGGDGTILYSLQRTRLPILPVNAGTVGFLAEIEGTSTTAFDGAIERLLRGSYFLEERMRIASEMAGRQLPDATNELVVHTSQVTKMRLFEIQVDRRPVGRLRADGVIVATATGSTSYALSALGPIVDPGIEAIIVAALAPFHPTQRALVIDPLRSVGVRLVHPDKEGVVVVDGQSEFRIEGGGTVTAYRSPRNATFVRFGGRFFRQLQGKKILPWAEEITADEGIDRADLPPPA
ncbi:MAG TPA: NAD(+)/NADH kinase [Thermoplasmata archaeon]|nr:NAD(+)/NADH kinase [Thermoplasmata archaeon]